MKFNTYRANLLCLMRNLTEVESGTDEVIATPAQPLKYKALEINFDSGKVTLLFELGSLYLQGFKNKNKELFIFKDVTYAINPTKKFRLSTDYGSLGLDRNSPIYLSLDDLSNALNTLSNTNKDDDFRTVKKPMWQCAVGLSEALRFHDVCSAVQNGASIPSLDWERRTKENDYLVRVKHR